MRETELGLFNKKGCLMWGPVEAAIDESGAIYLDGTEWDSLKELNMQEESGNIWLEMGQADDVFGNYRW